MEGMTLEKLQVIIEAYTKPYRDELDKVKKQTSAATAHVERQTAKIQNSFRKVGKVVAAVLSVGAIVAFGKSCIDLGSDLTEVQNVVDVTFGSMSKRVDAFSKNAINQFGLSELTAKKYMGIYGAMAKSFGIVEEAGYQMSASITGLTGDVASFYNLSTDEAYTKLKSIFTGETESLKELGVVMTQTALDQYALNNGFGKTTAKMTEQEKVMLRYRFVMSSLSDASGDFARTSGNWANQVRILTLQFESLKATIGQGLINAFTPVIQVINVILAKLQTLAAYFKAFTAALFGDASGDSSAVSDAASSMAAAAGSSGDVADNMGSAAKSAADMKKSLAAFDEINNLTGDSGAGGSGGGGGAGGADFGELNGTLFGDVTINPEIEADTNRIKEAVEALKNAAAPTTEALKRLWNEGLAKLGKFTWTALKDFWEYFLKPLGLWSLGEGLPRFFDITNNILKDIDWENLNESLRTLWKALEPFAETIGNGLLWFYENVLSPLTVWAVGTVLPEVFKLFASALEAVNKIALVVGPILADLYDDILKPFGEWLGDVFVDSLKGWQKAFDALGNCVEAHPEIGAILTGIALGIAALTIAMNANPFALIVTGIMAVVVGLGYLIEHWDEVTAAFKDGWANIKQYFEDGWNNIKSWWDSSALVVWWTESVAPWFTAKKWSDLYNSIKTQMKAKWDETVGQWKTDITNWWNSNVVVWFSSEKWSSGLSGVKNGFKSAFQSAFDAVKGLWNEFANWLNSKLTFDIDPISIMGQTVFDGATINLGKIPTFASGGFPQLGQMFVAREAGPEMIGRIGNRTAVANNDQIVDAISKGVYMAVSNAGGTNEDSLYRALKRALQEVDLTAVMDTDRTFKAMQKKAAEYRKRTGKPAFGY